MTSIAGAKYRLASTNFDQSLDAGGGTSSSANFISAELGNGTALNGRTYAFSFQNIAGEGLVFRMSSGNQISTLAWGSFAFSQITPGTGTSVSVINGETVPSAYNAINLAARGGTGSATSFMSFSDLTFSSSLAQFGAFSNGTATTASGVIDQWLVAGPGVNLASFNWALTGTLNGSGASNGGENVRFVMDLKDVAVVPAPATLPLFVSGLLLAGAFARRVRRVATA
ncbi:MAG: PEP-CTERM sorting domain-containing protein [Proteobacteria bacterium]|nr:PEP-CTERM sorting domain-containing protein [Burkholderiales bacterium]